MEEEELPLMLRLASISSDWEGNEDEGQSEDHEVEEEEEEETVPSITAQEQERRRKKNILVDFIHELLPKAVAAFHEDQEQKLAVQRQEELAVQRQRQELAHEPLPLPQAREAPAPDPVEYLPRGQHYDPIVGQIGRLDIQVLPYIPWCEGDDGVLREVQPESPWTDFYPQGMWIDEIHHQWKQEHDGLLHTISQVYGTASDARSLITQAFHEALGYPEDVVHEQLAQVYPEPRQVFGQTVNLTHWFCHICYEFDCGQHALGETTEAKLPYLPASTEEEVLAQHREHCSKDCAFLALKAVQASQEQIELSSDEVLCFSLVFPLHGPNFCQIACDLGVQVTCSQVGGFYFQSKEDFMTALVQEQDQMMHTNENSKPSSQAKSKQQEIMSGREQEKKDAYMYCTCQGQCDTNCQCLVNGTGCEIQCLCPKSCHTRWRGCHCHAGNNACGTNRCPCFKARRECMPDLCAAFKPGQKGHSCNNTNLLYSHTNKRLLVVNNTAIQGWGLFAGEPIHKGEFIGAYAGEYVSPQETAAREEVVLASRQPSYIFRLTSNGPQLDAATIGNKLRFANHTEDAIANVRATNKTMAGQQHIYFYATKDIPTGLELLYSYGADYNYSEMSPLDASVIAGKQDKI